jgi:hypothetical protein
MEAHPSSTKEKYQIDLSTMLVYGTMPYIFLDFFSITQTLSKF